MHADRLGENYCVPRWLLLKARRLSGAVAQLGEHHVRNVGVGSSTLLRSTSNIKGLCKLVIMPF